MATMEEIQLVRTKHLSKLMKKKNVVGVGIGYKVKGGQKTEQLSLVVLVKKKEDLGQLSKKDVVPSDVNGVVTDVKEVGEVVALKPRTDRWRPAPGGVSIGHYAITAGTLGAIVRDVITGKKLILSNNHVLANSNDASKGDSIVQPGPADGGRAPQDRIADLERFVSIKFKGGDEPDCFLAKWIACLANFFARILGSKHRLFPAKISAESNEVDAAVAKPIDESVIKGEILEIGEVRGTLEPALGLSVRKSGRTTALTTGTIETLNATIEVGYSGSKKAIFENQILTTNMSQPGDSGSLLVDASSNRAVGLLFAGSSEITVHCPISRVTELLSITFD